MVLCMICRFQAACTPQQSNCCPWSECSCSAVEKWKKSWLVSLLAIVTASWLWIAALPRSVWNSHQQLKCSCFHFQTREIAPRISVPTFSIGQPAMRNSGLWYRSLPPGALGTVSAPVLHVIVVPRPVKLLIETDKCFVHSQVGCQRTLVQIL